MDEEIKTILEALRFTYSSIYQPNTGASARDGVHSGERGRGPLALQAMEQQQQEEDYDLEIEM